MVGPHVIRIRIALAGGGAWIVWVAGGHGVAVGVVRVLELVVGHRSSLLLLRSEMLTLWDWRTA